MIKLGQRIATLRNAKGWTQKQLAEACGWDGQSRIGNYERDTREPTLHDMELIARALGVTVKEMLFGPEEQLTGAGRIVTYDHAEELSQDDYVLIDRYDLELSADGVLNWIVREDDQLAFRKSYADERGFVPGNVKALYMAGDSMEPYLSAGDTVVINVTDTAPKDGEVYAVCLGDEWLIKRIFKAPGGLILHSDNSVKYRDIDAIGERASFVRILGKVVWRGG